MTREPFQLLKGDELSAEQRELLDAARKEPDPSFDLDQALSRFSRWQAHAAAGELLSEQAAHATAELVTKAKGPWLAAAPKLVWVASLLALAGAGFHLVMRGNSGSPARPQPEAAALPEHGSPSQVAAIRPTEASRAAALEPNATAERAQDIARTDRSVQRGAALADLRSRAEPRASTSSSPSSRASAKATARSLRRDAQAAAPSSEQERSKPSSEAKPASRAEATKPAAASTPEQPALEARQKPAASTVDSVSELEALSHARTLVYSDPRRALVALDHLKRDFPEGYFREEGSALTVIASVRSGDLKAAEALGQRHLRSYPNGPFSDRIRQLLRLPEAGAQ